MIVAAMGLIQNCDAAFRMGDLRHRYIGGLFGVQKVLQVDDLVIAFYGTLQAGG